MWIRRKTHDELMAWTRYATALAGVRVQVSTAQWLPSKNRALTAGVVTPLDYLAETRLADLSLAQAANIARYSGGTPGVARVIGNEILAAPPTAGPVMLTVELVGLPDWMPR